MVDLEEDVTVTNVIITSRDEGGRLKPIFAPFIYFIKLVLKMKSKCKVGPSPISLN